MSIRHALMRELAERMLHWVGHSPDSPARGTAKPLDALTHLLENRVLAKVETPAGPGLDGWTVAVILHPIAETPSQDTLTTPQDRADTHPAPTPPTTAADAEPAPPAPRGAPLAPAVIASVTWTWNHRGHLDRVTWTGYDQHAAYRSRGNAELGYPPAGAAEPQEPAERTAAGPVGPAAD